MPFSINKSPGLPLLLMSAFFSTSEALAAADVVSCDGCDSGEKNAVARSATQSGRVYVSDKIGDTVSAYDVTTYSQFNLPATVAVLTSTPVRIQSYFDKIIVQYHTSQGPGVAIPASVAESAHSLVGNSQLQAEVGLWLMGTFFEQPVSGGQPDEELEDLRDEIVSGEPVKTVFSDDSTARFAYVDFAVGDAEFDLIDDTMSDAQNNDIPDSPGDVQPGMTGSFSSGGPGGLGLRDDFVSTLGLLGIGTSGGGISGGGNCASFTCSSAPHGVECVFTIGC